jgi:outer membrane lipoprotein carrier protein
MMKKTLLLSLALALHAQIAIKTLHSRFIQVVTDDQNSTLTYEGELLFKAPNLALWHYERPLKKTILIHGKRMVVVEPELEQVTYSQLKNERNLLKLMKKARKVGPDHYRMVVEHKEVDIFTHNGILRRMEFEDDLGNNVVITFIDPKQNRELADSLFELRIPREYDTIVR